MGQALKIGRQVINGIGYAGRIVLYTGGLMFWFMFWGITMEDGTDACARSIHATVSAAPFLNFTALVGFAVLGFSWLTSPWGPWQEEPKYDTQVGRATLRRSGDERP